MAHFGRTAREPLLAKGQAAKRKGLIAIVVAAATAGRRRNARQAFATIGWLLAAANPARFHRRALGTIVVGTAVRATAVYARRAQ